VEATALGESYGLAQREPHQKGANQTRTPGGRHDVHFAQFETSLLKCRLADRRPILEMLTRSDFGHHATEGSVRLELTRDHRGEDAAVPIHHGACRVVTGGFDPEGNGSRQAHHNRE